LLTPYLELLGPNIGRKYFDKYSYPDVCREFFSILEAKTTAYLNSGRSELNKFLRILTYTIGHKLISVKQ
jgi:hypothetical protein